MSEAPAILEKKEKNWITRILKLTFILSALLLIGITVLYNMGGSNDSLKDSVQRFISGIFQGRPATVDRLVNMSFFPRLGFDAEGINVLSSADDDYKIVEIGKVQVFMGFWNVALRNPLVKQFYIEDFKAIKGALGPKEFYIEKIFINHDIENNSAQLNGNGKIGNDPWAFKIDIEIHGDKGNYSYMFGEISPFIFDIADINIIGKFIRHEDGYFKFEDFNITSEDIELRGDLTLSALGRKILKLRGELFSKDGNKPLSPDLIFDYSRSPVKIDGTISSGISKEKDSILAILLKLREIAGYQIAMKGEEDSNNKDYNWSSLFDFSAVKIRSEE